MKDVMIIGIAGGTGSGKTTLTEQIMRRFGDDVSVIRHDNYYLAHDDLTYEERAALNYDCPEAYETSLLIHHLQELKEGRAVDSPVYDYKVHNRSAQTTRILPQKVILLEGILIFENPELCSQMDIKIFVDTDADVRILRRILRDVRDRARSLESVVDQYLTTVKPMHEQYVEPSKRNADIIVPEGGKNLVALDIIFTRIQNHIAGTAR